MKQQGRGHGERATGTSGPRREGLLFPLASGIPQRSAGGCPGLGPQAPEPEGPCVRGFCGPDPAASSSAREETSQVGGEGCQRCRRSLGSLSPGACHAPFQAEVNSFPGASLPTSARPGGATSQLRDP